MGIRHPTQESKNEIVHTIMNELEHIAKSEETWLDWNEPTTRKYVQGIVDKGYNAPGCRSVLIPQGYCVGKCWRYNDDIKN